MRTQITRYLLFSLLIFSLVSVSIAQDDIPPTPTDAERLLSPVQRERISAQNADEITLAAMVELPGANEVAWSPGGSVLAIAGIDRVWLYDSSSLDPYAPISYPRELPQITPVRDILFTPDGSQLAVVMDGFIQMWDVVSGTQAARYVLRARDVAFSPDGRLIAYVAYDTSELHIYDISRQDDYAIPQAIIPESRGVAFNPRGRTVAAFGGDGQLQVWDVLSATLVDSYDFSALTAINRDEGINAPRDAVAFSDDGRTVAVADFGFGLKQIGRDNFFVAPMIEYGIRQPDAPRDFERYYSVVVNTRANLVATAGGIADPARYGENVIRLWLLNGGGEIAILHHPGVRSVAFSPDGRLMASAGNNFVRLWTPEGGLPTPDQARDYSQRNVVAGCTSYEVDPGRVEFNETVSLVWSWYALNEDYLQQHLDKVQYRVVLDGRALNTFSFASQVINDPVNDGDPTVYFYAPVGLLNAGSHEASVTATWGTQINDGYAPYGPNSLNPSDIARCSFRVGS